MTPWPTVPPNAKTPRRDPSIIRGAPTEPDPLDFDPAQSQRYLEMVGELSAENERLRADVARLEGQETYDDVRKRMMEPYAGKVFGFLIWYCVFVGVIILLSGFKAWGFRISDTVLAVIASSTAASAIGLVGFVVSGLFGAAKATRGPTR